jgi:arylsulfatase A-like enzyme
VPAKWFEQHPVESVETPPYRRDDLEDVPVMGQRMANVPMMPTTEGLKSRGQWKEAVQAYLVCCTWTDHWVGELIKALDKSPYADNTIIVLWSDHGYHLGEKNRFAKQALWERDTHVPLIFAGPGIEGGRSCSAPVGLIDVYPTLLDLCGLPPNPRNEGTTLAPLLDDVVHAWDRPVITAYGPVNYAIRSKRYHYIRYEDGSEELYDIEKDPNEWTNLAGKESMSKILESHRNYIPQNAAPLAKKTEFNNFNPYFDARLKAWEKRDSGSMDPERN